VVEVGGDQAVVWGWDERSTGNSASAGAGSLTKGFETALARAEGTAHDRANRWLVTDQMVVGLPASQLRGWAWPVIQRRTQPERPVDERELEALLGRALRLAVNRLREPDERNWLVLEAVPVALTVDGRGVTDPVGFRGHEIGATVFAALAPAETVQTWQEVAEALDFATLTLTAAPLALAASMPELQGVVVDVGGATTDLTWWRSGRPLAVDSLPMGGVSLTQALLRRWGLPPEKAESLKRAYVAGRLTTEARAQVLEPMLPAVRAWLELTEASLAEMSEKADEPLPHRLFLCGGGTSMPEIVEAARSLVWSERLRFERHPQLDPLRPTDVTGVFNRTDCGQGPGDGPALALAAWAGRQRRPPDRPAQILSKLCAA
jgi:cell division protein FtsA